MEVKGIAKSATPFEMPQSEEDKDLYLKMMELERELEYMTMQEEVLRDEQRHLQSEYIRSKEEIKAIQATYLDTSNFVEMIDGNYAITGSASSGKYVRVLSTLDREQLKPNTQVAVHARSGAVVNILPPDTESAVQMMKMAEKPDVTYADVGGLDM